MRQVQLITVGGVERRFTALNAQFTTLQQALSSLQTEFNQLPPLPDLSLYATFSALNDAIDDVTASISDLQTALNNKAASVHTHASTAIDGLAQLLEGKANQADLTSLAQAFGDHSHSILWDSPGAIGGTTPNSAFFTTLTVRSGTSTALLTDTTGGVRFPTRVGFYDKQPIGKPSVTGSRSSGAALGSILNALHNLGLITNNTSA